MFIDFHSHVLPDIDDGAQNIDMAFAMLEMFQKQKVGILAATPHFYAHKQPLEEYLQRRKQSLDLLLSRRLNGMPEIVLGAEVYVERGLRDLDLRSLCYGQTDYLLVELPYTDYQSWFLEEVYNFSLSQSLTPVFAHIDRYLEIYNETAVNEVLDFDDAVFQVNQEALFRHDSRNTILRLIKQGKPVLFGSDSHNTRIRCSHELRAQSVLKSKLGKRWLAEYEAYSLKVIGSPKTT